MMTAPTDHHDVMPGACVADCCANNACPQGLLFVSDTPCFTALAKVSTKIFVAPSLAAAGKNHRRMAPFRAGSDVIGGALPPQVR